ncbi:MAG: ATP-binding protein [Steroidobacterales bacterium]|jgi:PAS domain S-box-containing protein
MRDIVAKYGTVRIALSGRLTRATTASWLPLCLAVAAFLIDFFTPRAVTDYYVLPIFACLGARSPRVPLRTAALITPLLILGFFVAPTGAGTLTVSLLNRAMTLVIVWTGAMLTMWRLQSSAAAEKAHAEARASERRFRLMADGVPAMIWVTDRQANLEFVNREYCEFLGTTFEEAQQRGWQKFLHPTDGAGYLLQLDAAVAQQSGFCARIRLRHAAGAWRWVESSAVPRFAEGGAFLGHVGLSYDITAIVEAEQGLRDADRRKDEFLAMLSHELRNPLAPMRNAAEILASPAVNARQLQWASGVIRRQTAQMTALLDDLLDLARIAQGRLSLRLEAVSFKSVLDSAIEAARPSIERKDHLFTVSISPGESMVRADPARLSQVISNILVNAAKYTDPGGRIDLHARAVDGGLRVSIKDNGIGIPPQSLGHIFTLFSQVDAASTRIDGGIGIGLALVKGIVELHGGTVEARSEGPGRGSEFIVRLPLVFSNDAASSVRASDLGAVPTCRRVVIADDNTDAAETLAMLLEVAGHDVRVAHDGCGALSLARAFRPQVAILDIGMPQLDGYAVARALRKEPWGADLLVIALTGRGQEEDKRQAAAAGFDVHLTKPVDPGRVTSLVGARSAAPDSVI